jgi:hypothetical protein
MITLITSIILLSIGFGTLLRIRRVVSKLVVVEVESR